VKRALRAQFAAQSAIRLAVRLPIFAAALLALVLASCGPDHARFQSSDVTGAAFGHDFKLTDHTGQTRTLADFRGKVVVMFFGYTQCPDVCPTTLADLAAALQKLGSDASRVQVLFVTIDPERDTPELLAHYVPAFNPTFLGLSGDAAATAATAREFKVLYQKQPGSTPGSYSMDHTAGTFVFDPQGRLRLFVSHGQGPDVFAHDIRELLRAAS
jgi:protein SCO1